MTITPQQLEFAFTLQGHLIDNGADVELNENDVHFKDTVYQTIALQCKVDGKQQNLYVQQRSVDLFADDKLAAYAQRVMASFKHTIDYSFITDKLNKLLKR